MGLTAMVVGSVSGFGMQMMNNALQKVPLSRSELRLTCLNFFSFYGLYVLMSGIRFTKPYYHCVHGGEMIIVAFGCVMMGAIIHYLLALTRHVSNFIHINIIFMHILISLPFPLSFKKKQNHGFT